MIVVRILFLPILANPWSYDNFIQVEKTHPTPIHESVTMQPSPMLNKPMLNHPKRQIPAPIYPT